MMLSDEVAPPARRRAELLDHPGLTSQPYLECDTARGGVPSLWPLNNAPGTVVSLMNPGNIDAVFIPGTAKKWRVDLVGVDRTAEEARDAVMRRAGFSVSFLG